jgi:hypothetical protein
MGSGTPAIDGSDPARLLSVGEAARLVGVSESTLRRLIKDGQILYEVARGDGRERPMVRLVDLRDAYPERLGAPAERAPAPAAGPAHGPAQRVAEAAPGKTVVQLAAVQAARDALAGQVADLHVQRDDLKEQCSDLRGRLTIVERERQAGTAGLLLAQKRLLEIEAASAPPPAPWFARGSTWGFAGVIVVLAWFLRGQVVVARELGGQRAGLADALDSERAARAGDAQAFERGLGEALDAARAALLGERDAARDERARFASELEEARARDGALRATLAEQQAELARQQQVAEEERARFAQQLRAEREATAQERERLAAELAQARAEYAEEREQRDALLASLRAGSDLTLEAARELAAELERARAAAREAQARVRALEGALEPEKTSGPSSWWLRLWTLRAGERSGDLAARRTRPDAPE